MFIYKTKVESRNSNKSRIKWRKSEDPNYYPVLLHKRLEGAPAPTIRNLPFAFVKAPTIQDTLNIAFFSKF